MKIAVCISYVPDSITKIKISDTGKSISGDGVSYILNPYDEFAVEEAVRTKEKFGGEVYAISFGTEKDRDVIKKAFQQGADKGIFILSENENYDSYTVAKNLADTIKKLSPDIIFTGKQSIDFDGYLVPNFLSEILELPSVNITTKLEISDNNVKAERDTEGGKETIEFKLPAIITTQKGINEPRYPNIKSIMAAKSKPIETIKAKFTDSLTEITEMKIPPLKSRRKIFSNGTSDACELVRLLREEAKII